MASLAVAAELGLTEVGFDKKTARDLAASVPAEVILRQIELLPSRRATKNPLGLLRRAIEENWPGPETTDVGSSLGSTFAANFYAGYHGNDSAPVSVPSPADAEAAERFVARLLEVSPKRDEVPTWARQFGALVAGHHGRRRQNFPALRPAIQQYGDDFYSRLRATHETERRRALEEARSAHYQRFELPYREYLQAALIRHEAENTKLFQALLSEEDEKLKVLRANRFGLNVDHWVSQYRESRLERFQQMIIFETEHDVLDFWQWDKEQNPEAFNEASL